MYIDTHTHLSSEDYDDIDKVINDARINGVEILIVSCCTKKDILEGLELINKYRNIYLTIGFHPDQVDNISCSDIDWLKNVIISNDRIVGIGEIGLDYHYGEKTRIAQIKLFKEQMGLAVELNLPVVIHTRDALIDTMKIIDKYKLKGIIHCFSGSLGTARQYIKMGYLLGIGGVLTFKKSKIQEYVKDIDLNNIVLETDSPYLSPEPYRGEKNESKNIPLIAKKLSEIKEKDISYVEKITTDNAIRLFDLEH